VGSSARIKSFAHLVNHRGERRKKKCFVAVDPKQKNFQYFQGASLIKPNQKEAVHMVNHAIKKKEDILKASKEIIGNLKLDAVLITLGGKGMALYQKGSQFDVFPPVARKVFDVTGAGDTVISTLTALFAAGAKLQEAAFLANQAASIVVAEVGAAAPNLRDLKKSLR